jgi:DNA recombination protein RmuC
MTFASLVIGGVALVIGYLFGVASARHRTNIGAPFAPATGSLDARLESVNTELERVNALVRTLERDRAEQYGALAGHLRVASEQTAKLADTTRALSDALGHPKARGQWGERMADDVLRLAGFAEGINYRRQTGLSGGGIPDFTFLLPHGQVLHMDVKFPLDNYVRFLEAKSSDDARRLRSAFVRDVRQRVKELADRRYAGDGGPTGPNCVLLFIPNEAVYAFLHEHDPGALDAALQSGVVLCSPLTLFAVLAVIRQAVDNFSLEQTSREILEVLGGFRAEWERFVTQMDVVGRRLESAQREFDALAGTRRRQLEKPLALVDELRRGAGAAPPAIHRDEEEDDRGEEATILRPLEFGVPMRPG